MNIKKAFPSKYLAAIDLDGQERVATIAEYRMEEIGEEKTEKPVIYFEGNCKPVILNVTNANLIAEALGSEEMDDWVGKQITLYPTRVPFKGKRVDAIRVKEDAPAHEQPSAEEGDPGPSDEDVPF